MLLKTTFILENDKDQQWEKELSIADHFGSAHHPGAQSWSTISAFVLQGYPSADKIMASKYRCLSAGQRHVVTVVRALYEFFFLHDVGGDGAVVGTCKDDLLVIDEFTSYLDRPSARRSWTHLAYWRDSNLEMISFLA